MSKKKFYKEQRNHSAFFIDAAEQVVAWNAIAMNKSPEDFKEFAKSFDQAKFELQINLVSEELKEYRDAFALNDHVEMLDAAADTFVVAGFLTYMFFGPEMQNSFLEFPVGDHLPNDPYESITRAREAFTTAEQMAYLSAAIFRMSRDSLVTANYDGKAVLTEVLRSNMSKFPTADRLRENHGFYRDQDMGIVIQRELEWLEANRKDYTGFTSSYNDQYGVYVFHDANGKIMKPSTFSPANVKQFVGE